MSAQAAGFATARASATAGGEPVEIVVDAGGTVVGRVVDTAGRPVEGALLRGEPAEPESRADRPFLWARTGEDGDGRFTIRDATPATYVLRASAAGSGEASLTAVKVVAGRTTDVGTIALGRGGTVAGVVVDADGQAVPGATVRVDRGSRRRSSDDQTAQTDSSGSFEVRGVPPGRVEVVAGHPAYVAGRVRDVEVDAEKEPTPVRIVLTRGGRIEGHARRRDGRPFEDGRVAVSPAGGHTGFTAEPAPTLPDGSFVLEHVPAGRAIVSLLTRVSSHPSMSASPGMTILAGVASRGVDVREGETASLDIVTREVVVAGRVTRGGQGLPGVVVGVMGGDSMDVSGFMGTSPTALAPLSGPPPLTATTREDGGYELVVFGPGRSYVEMRSSERQDFPGREVDIPDVERYELDLEVGEASVSGVVVDEDSGAPVPEVQVGLREPGPDGAWKASGATGPDGRFAIAAEPGEYVLTARARSRKAAAMPVTVGPGGLSDLRVEMEAGLDVRGHVLDAAGRPAPDVYVVAFDAEGRRPGAYGRVNTLPDGSFRLGGLDAKPYTLVCGGPGRAGFAMRSGVTPGGDPVTLTLRPGGRVLVRIVGPDGTPVTKDVWPRVAAWDGVPVAAVPEADTRVTDAPGVFELSVPAGSIEIAVGGPKPLGRATARVAAGQTTTVELVVREPPAR